MTYRSLVGTCRRSSPGLGIAVVWLCRHLAIVLGAWFLTLDMEAATTTVAPTALETDRGERSSQPVSVLSTQEESGQSDGWNNYIEFYGAPAGYEGRFHFSVPASVNTASSSLSLQLSVHYRGPSVGGQRWRFEIFDQTAGTYLFLGDNAAVQSWVWSSLTFTIPAGNLQRFLANGEAQIKFVTDIPVDDCDLDYLALVFDDVATPTPTPTSAMSFAEITTDFPNPERGFLRFSDLLPTTDFEAIRASGSSLAYTRVQLNNFRTSPISQAFLDNLSQAFTKLRNAGLKAIVRFQYDEAGGRDASQDQILAHIEQLKPILRQNSHLIAALQAGFIGAWAEWHTSVNGLDRDTPAKSAILLALLDAVPDRCVQIRTPTHKADIFGDNFPMTESDAFSTNHYARVGHLNDAFLGSDTDLGTYPWDALNFWKSLVASETRFVPMGGEALYNPPRSNGINALAEMALLHFSYLNLDYQQQVIDSWREDGTYPEIRRRMGYRFVLRNGSVASSAERGRNLSLTLQMENVGFAAMYNPRPILLVFSNGSYRYEIPVTGQNVDPRRWLPGATIELDAQIPIPPTMEPGNYQLSLWLPDPHPDLRGDARYAVRFANQGTWNALAGENALGVSTTILTAPPKPPHLRAVLEQGVVALQITGNPGETYIIEASDVTPDWEAIGTQTLTDKVGVFVDPAQKQHPERLYRIRK
jgi:Domain of unknown function (DUF4832)/Domain of unknown function (DUF4874)/N-terminal glycosyl-hydrolase-114-associated domain